MRTFCEKHRIRRLEIFGSAAGGLATSSSDVDLLVTLDESNPVSTSGNSGIVMNFLSRRSVNQPERASVRFS